MKTACYIIIFLLYHQHSFLSKIPHTAIFFFSSIQGKCHKYTKRLSVRYLRQSHNLYSKNSAFFTVFFLPSTPTWITVHHSDRWNAQKYLCKKVVLTIMRHPGTKETTQVPLKFRRSGLEV